MNAAEFVLETLAHYVKRSEGPPPGIPAHAGPAFETRFAAVCVDHGVSPVVSRSLDRLVLPPSISRVTVARLHAHADATVETASRRLRALLRALETFTRAGVPALAMGDAVSAATLYGGDDVRCVRRLELLVREADVHAALAAAHSAGFAGFPPEGVHPVLGAGAPATTTRGATEATAAALARDVVAFHHYMTPLVLRNDDGDRLELRFRVGRFAHPGVAGERAWERARTIEIDGTHVRAVGPGDHLADLLARIGASGCVDIAAIADAGAIVVCHAGELDWGNLAERARMNGTYAALRHALTHVGRALHLAQPENSLGPPTRFTEKWLDLFWQPASIDYTVGPDHDRRFLYGLAACGGLFEKLDWVARSWVPKPSWVRNAVGDPTSPMNWLEFIMMARSNRRDARASGTTGREPASRTGTVRRFQRRKP